MSEINVKICENWIRLINPLEDLDFQKKYWFDYEGPMISSFDEARDNFLHHCEIRLNDPNFQKFCDQECLQLLKELYQTVDQYRMDGERILEHDPEIALLEDPKWLRIVNMAQQTTLALKDNIKEAKKNAER